MAGRTRFRVAARRGDRQYFASLREHLIQCPGVLSVTTSELTGSVLVDHDAADPDVLVAYARTFELFDVPESRAGGADRLRSPTDILTDRARRLDQWVRTETAGATDLRSVALTALIGAAVWQVLRGPVLPAAATLIWYAMAVAAGDQRQPGGGRQTPTAGSAHQEEIDSPVE
jgi:hypothetical protein